MKTHTSVLIILIPSWIYPAVVCIPSWNNFYACEKYRQDGYSMSSLRSNANDVWTFVLKTWPNFKVEHGACVMWSQGTRRGFTIEKLNQNNDRKRGLLTEKVLRMSSEEKWTRRKRCLWSSSRRLDLCLFMKCPPDYRSMEFITAMNV